MVEKPSTQGNSGTKLEQKLRSCRVKILTDITKMLNHARTLLVNYDAATGGTKGFSGHLAEELIDPDYRAKILPPYLQTIRNILFGNGASREVVNSKARAYLALLHATELKEFVTDLDPRISYDFSDKDVFENATDYYFSLGEVEANLILAPNPVILQLFKVADKEGGEEPFKTFYNLWRDHHEIAYKLGGLLLAYIYSIDKLTI